MPPPADRSRSANDAAVLDGLERRLDGVAFRATAHLAVRWQTRSRPFPPRRPVTLPGRDGLHAISADELLQALAAARDAGALESAEVFVGELLSRSDGLPKADVGGTVLLLETLLMLGKVPEAQELARLHRSRLMGTSAGLAALELLGIETGQDWLPNGRPHLLRWSRRLEHGELDAADLARLLTWHPRTWLRSPEVQLLLAASLLAQEPERALRFLNRFLRWHGCPPCSGLVGRGSNVLERLQFSRAGSHRDQRRLVSIVVAAHDAAHTVGYAVASLLNQTYENLEILVGDDASRDGTLEVLKASFGDEPRVRLFRSSQNQGAYNLRNALAAQARGELLTFHDADDLAWPNRIACQVEQLRNPRVTACIGNFVRVRPHGSFVFFRDQKASHLCAVSLMLPRQVFAELGPFRSARFGADHELLEVLRTRLGARAVGRVRSPLLFGLAAAGSATRTAGGESLEDGYRSPARRAYSELVFAQHQPGGARPTGEDVDARLRAVGNYQAPSELLKA